MTAELTGSIGISGLMSMVVSLLCVAISWWALQNLKLDLIIRYPKSPQGRLLHLLLAIVLGHFVAGFLLDYLGYSTQIRHMLY
ncbi:membrane protein [Paenibacillus durus]|uniref:Membrane protein n=2 Tax=Paenibacillus durus TaxID=44251 RepID=A0A089HUU0_PAEDU|nr:membrane protein [Paenibacillus durus]